MYALQGNTVFVKFWIITELLIDSIKEFQSLTPCTYVHLAFKVVLAYTCFNLLLWHVTCNMIYFTLKMLRLSVNNSLLASNIIIEIPNLLNQRE